VGFQIIGRAFSENLILRAAHAIEGAVGFDAAPTFRDSSSMAGKIGPGGLCAQAAREAVDA
jgi:hypothetical protein